MRQPKTELIAQGQGAVRDLLNAAQAKIDGLTQTKTDEEVAEDIRDLAQALIKRFGNEQFIELTGTIGYFSMLCMTVNACELEAGKNHEVLSV